jgi:hypothetical protein
LRWLVAVLVACFSQTLCNIVTRRFTIVLLIVFPFLESLERSVIVTIQRKNMTPFRTSHMSLLARGNAPTRTAIIPAGTIDGFTYVNTSYVSIAAHPLAFGDDHYSAERDRAINHRTKGGIMPMTADELSAERKLDWALLKTFTRKILQMDLTKFPFPVAYSEPRSFLERMSDLFAFLCFDIIDRVYNCGVPEIRLNLLATGIIAGFHLYLQSKKPWNPVLGETYAADWGTGFQIFAEQISHHPPVSAFQILGRLGNWTCDGKCMFEVKSGLMQVDVIQRGLITLKFDDGSKFEWEFPTISVMGIVNGERITKGTGPLTIKDLTNDLVCTVDIPPKKGQVRGLESPTATTIYGGVYDGTGKNLVSIVRGDYCGTIYIDQEEAWNISTNLASRPRKDAPEDFLLPSDSRYRIDRAMLLKGRVPEADCAKQILEDMQRREEKLRQ